MRGTAGLLAAVGLLGCLVLATPAQACRCAAVQVEDPRIIFRGKAQAFELIQPAMRPDCRGGVGPECSPTPTVRFAVETMFKGAAGRREVLVSASKHDGVNCGVTLRVGRSYVVGADGDPEHGYYTNACLMFNEEDEEPEKYRRHVQQLRAAWAKEPGNRDRQADLAAFLQRHQDWEALSEVLREPLLTADLLALRGETDVMLARPEAALAAFDRALRLTPGHGDARRGRMRALLELGRIEAIGPGADFGLLKMEKVSLAGRDMSGSRFAGSSIQHLDMQGTKAAGADFRRATIFTLEAAAANLAGADFRHAHLRGDLSRADLGGASFRWTSMERMRFVGADLTGADFTAAFLLGADLSNAKLRDAVFLGAMMSQVVLAGADLSGQILVDASLTGADLRRSRLAGADLRRANLSAGTQLHGADLTGALLEGVVLKGAKFDCHTRWPAGFDPLRSGAVVETTAGCPGGAATRPDSAGRADAPKAEGAAADDGKARSYRDTVLTRDQVRSMGIDLAWVDLTGTALQIHPREWELPFNPLERGAFFTRVPAAVAKFGLPDLRGANLRGRNLFQANFSGVDLSGADLRGALLEQADLTNAVLDGTRLEGAVDHSLTRWSKGFDPKAAGLVYKEGDWGQRNGGPRRYRQGKPERASIPHFPGANLDRFNWGHCWLEEGKFAGASMRGTQLGSSNLTTADLRNVDLEQANLSNATLDGANLSGASLRNADLRWASLRGATLEGADLTGARYDEHTAWPEGFRPEPAGAVRE